MVARAQDRFVQLGTLSFHYSDWGGGGLPVLLLHGLASTCHIWDLMAPILAQRFRVVALDQRGHGGTEKPPSGYDFDTITDDVRSFVEALGVKSVLLVGHSWGGNVALHYAARFSEDIAGLVLVDGGFIEPAVLPDFTWEKAQEILTPPDLSGVTWQGLVQQARDWELASFWSAEIEGIVRANFIVGEDGFIKPRLDRETHMKIARAMWEHRPSKLYARVRCPVLLLPAFNVPKSEKAAGFQEIKRIALAQAQALIPICKLVRMDDTVHDIPLQRPRELSQAIEGFLQEYVQAHG